MKLKDWLGGLDSNQDSQIQNLESCQLDDLPTFVRDNSVSNQGVTKTGATKTNRSNFPGSGQLRFYLFRINAFPCSRQPVRSGCFARFLLFALPTAAISPFARNANSASPHTIRSEKKLPIHTANCSKSRSGSNHHLRRAASSRSPHTPTVPAIASRNAAYAPKNSRAPEADRVAIAPTIANGNPCVKNNPRYDAGRHSRTVRDQRI